LKEKKKKQTISSKKKRKKKKKRREEDSYLAIEMSNIITQYTMQLTLMGRRYLDKVMLYYIIVLWICVV